MTGLFIIAGAVGTYLAFPQLLVRFRCVDWPGHTLSGLDPGREYLYVAMGACNAVIAIDTRSHTVVAASRLEGSFPHGIAVSLDGRELYAANEHSHDVSVISLPDFSPVSSSRWEISPPADGYPTGLEENL